MSVWTLLVLANLSFILNDWLSKFALRRGSVHILRGQTNRIMLAMKSEHSAANK